MPTWVIQFIIWAATTAVSYFLAPKPTKPQPGTLQNFPVADQGTPIAVLMGRRIVKQPTCVWWGDVRTTPIKSSGK
jgi:hypothetical protein